MAKKDWGPLGDMVKDRRKACLNAIRTVSVLADAWEETHDEPEPLRAAVVALAVEMMTRDEVVALAYHHNIACYSKGRPTSFERYATPLERYATPLRISDPSNPVVRGAIAMLQRLK